MIIMLKVLFTILLLVGLVGLVAYTEHCLRCNDDILPELMIVLTVEYTLVISLVVFGMFAKYINN